MKPINGLRGIVPDLVEGDGRGKLNRVYVNIGSTSNPLPIEAALQFEVVADPSYLPPNLNGGSLEFNLTKAQLLRSRAKLIRSRLNGVTKGLASAPAAQPLLIRALLLRALHDEIEAVTKTEVDYLALETDPKLKDAASTAFDDLKGRYGLLERRVSTELRAEISRTPRVLLVGDKTEEAKVFELKEDVTRAIETNESGYLLMASTGEYVPTVRVETLPQGATISYFRESEKDSPHTLATKSDTDVEFLPYAFWTFRASKDGYTTTDVPYNAYADTHHVIQIPLQEKKR